MYKDILLSQIMGATLYFVNPKEIKKLYIPDYLYSFPVISIELLVDGLMRFEQDFGGRDLNYRKIERMKVEEDKHELLNMDKKRLKKELRDWEYRLEVIMKPDKTVKPSFLRDVKTYIRYIKAEIKSRKKFKR